MSDTADSIMARLKEATGDLHSHAESRPLQQQIARGEVDRDRFAVYLGQLYLVHRSLETSLERAKADHPSIDAVATPDRMRVPDLEKDLEFYRLSPQKIESTAATERFIDSIERLGADDPVALLGSLYVFEGSTNGGRFLAKVLRRVWGLDGGGLSYFDPYGDEQPHRWTAFKTDMDAADLNDEQRDAIVEAARATFQAIADVSDEVATLAGAA